MDDHLPLLFFDRERDYTIIERKLPHWSQAGVICFITWRTVDSLPKMVLDQWHHDRLQWLRTRGIDPNRSDWREQLRHLGRALEQQFLSEFWNRWHDALDDCQGECVLRDPKLAEIVADSLRHFDEDRYQLYDFVVMPNHVHLLAAVPDEDAMLDQCESWKHFTATRINRRLKRKQRFWQQDAFDHLVRSEEQYRHLQRYIAWNPKKARLSAAEFTHFSKNV